MESPKLGDLRGVINSEQLRTLYNQTDLTFTYVSQKCLELVGLKGCKISDDQVIFWFREMLKEKWTIAVFNSQYEIVKAVKRFGDTLDWQHWIMTERMYNEHDLNRKISEAINNKLNTGKRLLEILETDGVEKLINLSDGQKEALALRAVKEFLHEIASERGRVADEYLHEQKTKKRTAVSDLKKYLKTISVDKKKKLIDMMLQNEVLKGKIEDWDKDYFLNEFHLFYPEITSLEELLHKSIFVIVNEL